MVHENGNSVYSHHSLSDDLSQSIKQCSLLVVGAGGIGCELLKNLVLTGFEKIEVIDLDTIDVSNLNRQFLFQKKHVSKPKAVVARESVLRFNPRAVITAHHDTVMNPAFNADYFRSFTLVMNALDNKAARFHVNRMCLAAEVPLIESGTAGYLGQVTVIRKGLTECYECQPKPAQKTFPGCTIRNTPSEPVHCIVWAKHLFNQLFGEFDADNEVSPDTADPELVGEAGKKATMSTNGDNIERKSTREWAKEINYNAKKLFNKFFESDIKYLLSMEKLWQKRKAPSPLSFSIEPDSKSDSLVDCNMGLEDKRVWNLSECTEMFVGCVYDLMKRSESSDEPLVWDKDDEVALDFVVATANIRSIIFHIPQQSRFDVKSMAGNIIPAIATTNAVIAGLMVIESMKILARQFDKCSTVYLNRNVKTRNRLLGVEELQKPNPKCYVCASKPEVTVYADLSTFTCGMLEDRLLKEKLGMVAPDVEIDDGKGSILISSEPGETEDNQKRALQSFGIDNGTRLKCEDYQQDYELTVILRHKDDIEPPLAFLLEGDIPAFSASEERPPNDLNSLQSISPKDPGDVPSNTSPVRKRKHSFGSDFSGDIKRQKSEVNGQTNDFSSDVVDVDDDDELMIL